MDGDPVGEMKGARAKWIKRNIGRKPKKFVISAGFDARFCAALREPSAVRPVINLNTVDGQKFFGMAIEVDSSPGAEEINVIGPGLNRSRRRRRYAGKPRPGYEDRTIVLKRKRGDTEEKYVPSPAEKGKKPPPLPPGAEKVVPYDASILEAGLMGEKDEPKKRRRFAHGKEQDGPKT